MRQSFIDVLRSSADEQSALFSAAASDLETRAENIEKDLYVCWVLDFLFNRRKDDAIGLYFKGGTSLSKAYGLIQRFSEDIDIGIYKADLNVPLEADIAALPPSLSNRRHWQSRWTKPRGTICPAHSSVCLRRKSPRSKARSDKRDVLRSASGMIPTGRRKRSTFWCWDTEASSIRACGYVEAAVRIEGGARPDPVPAETRQIVPYIASEMPSGSDRAISNVMTVRPERTFWEKVLILHAMTEMTEKRNADQNTERKVPDLNRYSRHYYDVHQIWNHPDYGKTTASMLDLAEACRQHKELMFRAPDHRYDRAVPGSFRLVPTADMRKKLATDYERMSAMIFATPPDFETVMTSIEDLERFLNKEQAIG
ncbi:nucleotidyl transferase AbiEii/AbiGii toxin family protein (plasmid) [Rhizobium ruizarguesonis]|nr:nucleotidyl transferase AbiEii/AbiGii toxin family protein [Rhizobium ruizarguesonis]